MQISTPQGTNPAPPQAQTPQSQYLAAALKQLGSYQPSTGAGVAEGLLSQALLNHTQAQQQMTASSQGQPPMTGDALANTIAGLDAPSTAAGNTKPLDGLLGLGKQALQGLGSMFGGAGG